MRRCWPIIGTLLVLGCSKEPVDPVRAQDDDLKIRAEVQVERVLKDPKSAEFESFVSRISGEPVVCGTVNAKNSMGGYSGRQAFMFAGGSLVMAEQASPEDFANLWSRLCKPLTN